MQFAALFIEYFVSGACAVLWILPAIGIPLERLASLQQGPAVLLLPLVYVLGHAVDAASYSLIHPAKRMIKRDVGHHEVEISGSETAFILYKSADLGRHLQALSSRDRIARGAVLNSVLTAIAVLFRPAMYGVPASDRLGASAAALLLAAIMFAVWWRFERMSRRFLGEAVTVIDKYPNT